MRLSLAQRVQSRLGAWRRIGAPPSVLRWIANGVPIEWEEGPPSKFYRENYLIPPAAKTWWVNGEETRLIAYVDPTYPVHPIAYLLFNGLLPPTSRHHVTPRKLLGL